MQIGIVAKKVGLSVDAIRETTGSCPNLDSARPEKGYGVIMFSAAPGSRA